MLATRPTRVGWAGVQEQRGRHPWLPLRLHHHEACGEARLIRPCVGMLCLRACVLACARFECLQSDDPRRMRGGEVKWLSDSTPVIAAAAVRMCKHV